MRRDNVQHEGFRMPQWMRRWIYAVGAVCLASGSGWLLLHEFVTVEGEFGPMPHPLERPLLVLHGGAAWFAIFTLGLIWLGHLRRGLQHRGRNFPSGIVTLLLILFLALSAWGLYYLGAPELRERTATLHWIAGLLAALWLVVHVAPWQREQHPSRPPQAAPGTGAAPSPPGAPRLP